MRQHHEKQILDNGDKYEGEWNSSQQRHGFGICMSSGGALYEGYWSADKYSGCGHLVDVEGNVYCGEFEDG